MHVTIQCVHCSRPLKAPPEMAGRMVQCAGCNGQFVLPADLGSGALGETPTPPPSKPIPTRDETLSRSMLVRMPGAGRTPSTDLICRLEPRTLRWLELSEQLGEFLGASIAELRRESLLDRLHHDDRALAVDEFRQAVELGERHDFVLRMKARSGEWHYMRVHTQARYEHDGRINHIRCNLKDVTDRIRAEQELRRRTEQLTAANERLRQTNDKLKEAQSQLIHSEKLASLGTLAAGMAHEINNPLAFATNNVTVLERDIAAILAILARYREGWNALRDAKPELAAEIARLEEQIDLPYVERNLRGDRPVDAQGPEACRADRAEPARVRPARPRRDRRARREPVARPEPRHARRPACAEPDRREPRLRRAAPLECAPAHINQVFLNLLMNAMQAIETAGHAAGRLEVSTRRSDGEIVVVIADDGCGIPADVLPKIFDPFFTTKPIGGGTGLGLSLSHGIIAEHGGRVEVRSVVGSGTRFSIHLPIKRGGRV